MDYESILFGLQPLLNASNIEELPVQEVYLKSYLTVLDQLAVSLRSDSNRTIVGSNGLLKELTRVLLSVVDIWFHKDSENNAWPRLASELIRCVANSLIDNDRNRSAFLEFETGKGRHEFMDYYVGQLLKLNDYQDTQLISTLQVRTVVLVRNMCIDNETFSKRFAPYIRGPLLYLLTEAQHTYLHDSELAVLASDLLHDFIEAYSENVALTDLLFFAQFIERVSKTIDNQEKCSLESADDEEEDPSTEIAYSLTGCVETITKRYDDSKNFYTEPKTVSQIQNDLLNALDHLAPKEFPNKLIITRRITTAIGYISANGSNANKNERDMCYYSILNSSNGYTLAASLIILSNSISDRKGVNDILDKISLARIIEVGSHFRDPMQFQGYLDVVKKLLTLESAMMLQERDLQKLCSFIKICHDQSKYMTDISPLIDNLLKKLATVLPGTSLQKLLCGDSPLLGIFADRDSVLSCLALDKLLVARNATPESIKKALWKAAFKFQGTTGTQSAGDRADVSVFYLFQLAKTCGICLRDPNGKDDETLLADHIEDLEHLLNAVASLRNGTDRASQSVVNNGRFVAGMLYKILGQRATLTEEETSLRGLAKSLIGGTD